MQAGKRVLNNPGDLFEAGGFDPVQNHLPFDGAANYFGPVFASRADDFFARLTNGVGWQNDQVFMYGKRIDMQRKFAWYGDRPFSYTYSGLKRVAQNWTEDLISMKQLVEKQTQQEFNSCLLNLYHSGDEGMGWHSDNEKELVKGAPIASVSLGADRRFDFKHRQRDTQVHIQLHHGSLLLMDSQSQVHWLHQLPKTRKVTEPRINLTFRSMQSWTIAD